MVESNRRDIVVPSECHICLQTMQKPLVISSCDHVFCKGCILGLISMQQQQPICKAFLRILPSFIHSSVYFAQTRHSLVRCVDEHGRSMNCVRFRLASTTLRSRCKTWTHPKVRLTLRLRLPLTLSKNTTTQSSKSNLFSTKTPH